MFEPWIPWREIVENGLEDSARNWWGPMEWAAARSYFDNIGNLEDFEDSYVGTWHGYTDEDAVSEWIEQSGLVDFNGVPDTLIRYFDWESYARDLIYDGEVWVDYHSRDSRHIFWNR